MELRNETKFPLTKIGMVAEAVKRGEEVQPDNLYRQVGVRLWGEGAYERETIEGRATRK